jgi:hypothetical protein
MPERDELVSEAHELVALYRDSVGKTRGQDSDLEQVGYCLGRALEALEHRSRHTLATAQAEIAIAREVMARLRRKLRN